jgi:hypothetical protein
MNANPRSGLRKAAARKARKLRFPKLFVLVLVLFLLDLALPDAVPFADEIILGLLSVVLGTLRERRRTAQAEPVD